MRPSQFPDINHASSQELEQTFDLDADTARRLIRKRDELGGFQSWDELLQAGLSPEEISDLQTAGLTFGHISR